MSRNQNYPLWTELPYAGEERAPALDSAVEVEAGQWKTYFIEHSRRYGFKKKDGSPIRLAIRNPESINWQEELQQVKNTLQHLSEEQIKIAKYWGEGAASKQWSPIADRLIDTYGVEAPRAARMLGALFSGMNDAFVVCWYLKYKWLVPRPNQIDPKLATVICTPVHPSYPSGHATISGAAEVILSYFFPAERRKIRSLAEECAKSRLYAGVHYPVDNDEGLRLGRQIGQIVVDELSKDRVRGSRLDLPFSVYKNADLHPADYEQQAIPFDFNQTCGSLLINDHDEDSSDYDAWLDPKLFY
ncbi:vanadium-dependent haloperoxidase [Halobacillus litoralis]|uniref:vanadium-dependent haloperoxidase n=1 Tax=Halobacillus litoralis TaxID=45668 RepID=UPI001CFD2E56|nr:vanadium-dependent haloperoxidase [Halobacillus litoralis]